jgi:tRNA-dihydrouridine synthase
MIGRGALYNPFIFREIVEPGFKASEAMRIDLTIDYFRLLLEVLEPREALHKIKKIGGMFTRGIPGGGQFRQNLHLCQDPEPLIQQLEHLRSALVP